MTFEISFFAHEGQMLKGITVDIFQHGIPMACIAFCVKLMLTDVPMFRWLL